MVQTLTEQLHVAFKSSGMSVAELLAKSKLDLDRSSLSRKLHGEQPMRTDEAQVLASVLDATITWPPRKRAA